jgi:hypothetical protein
LVTLVLLYMEQYINLWVSTTLDHWSQNRSHLIGWIDSDRERVKPWQIPLVKNAELHSSV